MTKRELLDLLGQYPDDATVSLYDSDFDTYHEIAFVEPDERTLRDSADAVLCFEELPLVN